MLKRLELIGFKSFADKTHFDFHPGITAIVGPNGSGKSNIVDAVRWIMGEQSAKSLRGGEMADVIFNGSTSRRGFGLAEVSMVFDNAKRQLPLDLEEVRITRRVHRTGEGEYLINNQVCRLRDVKELFLGSGAGNDAYCIIEQGKVDVLLQASTRDRRVIFEEAAGISRFKARKVETLRKLERVDQNLARLKDIVDEVEKQHRSVKLQASKAQRYQEYAARLKELRLALGRQEHQRLSELLRGREAVLESLRVELDQRAARAGACEAEAERLEMQLADLDDALREHEARLAQVGQQIKAHETTQAHGDALNLDLEAERDTTRQRCNELGARVRLLAEAAMRSRETLAEILTRAEAEREAFGRQDAALRETLQRQHTLQTQIAADKAEHLEQMRRAARLHNDAVAARAHADNLLRERQRLEHRSSQTTESLATLDVELAGLETEEGEQQRRLAAARMALARTRDDRDRRRLECDETAGNIAALREERSGSASRAEMLEGLMRSHEGLGEGPREVFRLVEARAAGWGGVLGMLADFLTVKRDYAHLIDLALGEQAQRFVVRDLGALVAALGELPMPLPGRVSFLPLACGDAAAPAYAALRENNQIELSLLSRLRQIEAARGSDALAATTPLPDESSHPSMVAPADQLVSCDHPEMADLPALLLGRTLLVRDLDTARRLSAEAPGFRFVTLSGQLLDGDGTLTLGTHTGETGLLSRKSELIDLRERLERLDSELAVAEAKLAAARLALAEGGRLIQEQEEAIEVLAEQAADLRARVQQHRDRRQGLSQEATLQRGEIERLEDEISRLEASWQGARDEAAQAEAQVQALQLRLQENENAVHRLDQQRQQDQEASTAARVSLAKVEERLQAEQARHEQQARDLAQREAELAESGEGLAALEQRLRDAQLATLRASAALAELHLAKEELQGRIVLVMGQREARRQDRARLAQQAQSVRTEWRAQQEAFHQAELAAAELRHQLDTLVERLREDYQIDLRQESANESQESGVAGPQAQKDAEGEPPTRPLLDAAAAQEEIDELRRKLSRLGHVNLAALDELTELESRAASLQTQYDDVVEAKRSLDEIIAKINQDSRRLFQESFGVIRTHFQELFRKLFGGGMADIVLEDEADILESGIEINARPPGKELRSISLMSGGEKTLTAVALLLAIFRSKPSPFCILDEVDAALDEANIARFTAVLREFLDLSQFIIVTHSKKTMAVADVLYGITMQESGISKQVAIRFEDWVDEGQPAAATA